MKVLLVKTSSMGDLVHTLPAVTDLVRCLPRAEVTWIVEEGLANIPGWHPGVARVIPLPLRRWRREGPLAAFRKTMGLAKGLRNEGFDAVVDAQGLIRSAWLSAAVSRGASFGFAWGSAREPLASLLYGTRIPVPRASHALERTRTLLAGALGYDPPEPAPDFGLVNLFGTNRPGEGLVFIMGASWSSKLWPVERWRALAEKANAAGLGVTVVWGTEGERERAEVVRAGRTGVTVPETREGIEGVAELLSRARGVVGLDTGFTHIAAALGTPTVGIFGPTSPERVGLVGDHVRNLPADIDCHPCHKRTCPLDATAPPCHGSVPPERVWAELTSLLEAPPG
jgi:heptosyltransferase-1